MKSRAHKSKQLNNTKDTSQDNQLSEVQRERQIYLSKDSFSKFFTEDSELSQPSQIRVFSTFYIEVEKDFIHESQMEEQNVEVKSGPIRYKIWQSNQLNTEGTSQDHLSPELQKERQIYLANDPFSKHFTGNREMLQSSQIASTGYIEVEKNSVYQSLMDEQKVEVGLGPIRDQAKPSSEQKGLQSKHNYDHTKTQRRGKEELTPAQQNVPGYWSRNFSPFACTSLVNFFIKKGQAFWKANPELQEFKKNGASKEGFLSLCNVVALQPLLQEFFKKKMLYMDLMQSKLKHNIKLAYYESLDVFQMAFKSKSFKSLNILDWEQGYKQLRNNY